MAHNLLEQQPAAELRVYAVWYAMIPFDAASRVPVELFDDPRVVQYWDRERSLGRWYGTHPDYGADPSSVWWDTYVLYGPESRWIGAPTHRINLGYTIVETREELRASLAPLLAPAPSGGGKRAH